MYERLRVMRSDGVMAREGGEVEGLKIMGVLEHGIAKGFDTEDRSLWLFFLIGRGLIVRSERVNFNFNYSPNQTR